MGAKYFPGRSSSCEDREVRRNVVFEVTEEDKCGGVECAPKPDDVDTIIITPILDIRKLSCRWVK